MRKQLNTLYYCVTPSKTIYEIEEISAESETLDPQSYIVLKTELTKFNIIPRSSKGYSDICEHFASTKETMKVNVIAWLDDDLQEYGLYKSIKDAVEATC